MIFRVRAYLRRMGISGWRDHRAIVVRVPVCQCYSIRVPDLPVYGIGFTRWLCRAEDNPGIVDCRFVDVPRDAGRRDHCRAASPPLYATTILSRL